MARRAVKIVENLSIVDIAQKGMCIAKDPEGQVYLLKGGVPGDIVSARIRRKKKGMPFGDVTEITTQSPDRVEPFCQHFERCGGCKWQDLDYSAQAHYKEKQVHESIRRIAHITDYEARPIIKAERTREFRNKLEYTFSPRRWLSQEEVDSGDTFTDRRALGFHLSGAFDRILDVDKCHLMSPKHNDLRNAARELGRQLEISFYEPHSHLGILRNLMIRENTAGEMMVALIVSDMLDGLAERYLQPLIEQFPEVVSWHYIVNGKVNDSMDGLESVYYHGDTHLYESLGDRRFQISPLSFFQTNSYQAVSLYDQVRQYAALSGSEVLYDLYCGTGSIGIYLADGATTVIGVEINEAAIIDAKANAKLNELDHTQFYAGDVLDVVDDKFVKDHGAPDVVVIDPPRAGMHQDFAQFIKELSAPRIVYVSCNPSTLARDLALLEPRYKLESCTPVDMFPHTSHTEAVALLTITS